MAITSTVFQVEYSGNLSVVTPYQVPFQFLEGSHLVVEVLAAGGTVPVTLNLSAYTVTQNSGLTGSLVTVAAIPTDSTVTIRRPHRCCSRRNTRKAARSRPSPTRRRWNA